MASARLTGGIVLRLEQGTLSAADYGFNTGKCPAMIEKLFTRTLSINTNKTLDFENETHNECILKDT